MATELAEVISQLRAELASAMSAGADHELRFELGPVELEFSIAVSKEVKPGAKVKFWVVEAGSDASIGSNRTQTIRLTLNPHLASTPDRRPLISGEEEAGER